MILFDDAQRGAVRGDYAAGRLEPVKAAPGLWFLPEDLSAVFPEAELEQYPTTDDLLATAKAHMKAQLAAIRWGKTQVFPYDGVLAYAEPAMGPVLGKIRILEELGSNGPIKFKLNATAWRNMTIADLKAYGLAIDAFMQPYYDHEAAQGDQIDAASDFVAVNAIDLEAGWPS